MPVLENVKLTAVYKDSRRSSGWTESMYGVGFEKLDDAVNAFQNLNYYRVKMLGAGIVQDYASATQDDPRLLGDVAARPGLPFKIDAASGLPYYDATWSVQPTDYGWTAANMRISATNDYHRTMWLSGLPDIVTRTDRPTIVETQWIDQNLAWQQTLLSGKFGMKVFDKSQTRSPIFTITNVDTAGKVLTFSAAPPWQVGDTIFIHGIHGTPCNRKPHGEAQISSITGNTVIIVKGTADPSGTPPTVFKYSKGGYVRKRETLIVAFTYAILRGVGNKKRGRPLFQPRGRSRSRCGTCSILAG